jgi:hypothetical protein
VTVQGVSLQPIASLHVLLEKRCFCKAALATECTALITPANPTWTARGQRVLTEIMRQFAIILGLRYVWVTGAALSGQLETWLRLLSQNRVQLV